MLHEKQKVCPSEYKELASDEPHVSHGKCLTNSLSELSVCISLSAVISKPIVNRQQKPVNYVVNSFIVFMVYISKKITEVFCVEFRCAVL